MYKEIYYYKCIKKYKLFRIEVFFFLNSVRVYFSDKIYIILFI